MAQIKYTKIELVKYTKRRALFLKYLPTLQLKKMLLQIEVYKAQAEIDEKIKKWEEEHALVKKEASLLTDPCRKELYERVQVEELIIAKENIAGIDVPSLKEVVFTQVEPKLLTQPVWFEDFVALLKFSKICFEQVRIARKKKEILEQELRTVSIRVNLFEKRLIPETTKIIGKIRVFLGDQDLQAVASAKVSKNKILQKKRREAV